MTAKSAALLDSDSSDESGDEEQRISVNRKFAKEYEIRKQEQELHRARLAGEDHSESDSEEESEDEDGELLTSKLDTNIMKTLNALRNKDKSIYDTNKKFFDERIAESDDDDEKPQRREKAKKYKDVVREQILEEMERDDNVEGDGAEKAQFKSQLAYDDEQRDIRKAFLTSTKDSDDDDDDDGADFMVVKKKHQDQDEDEKEFIEEVEKLEKSMKSVAGKPSSIVDPKGEVKDGEQFLLNFFKKKSWIDQDQDKFSDNDDSNDDSGDEQVPMKGLDSSKNKDGNESDDSLDQLDNTDDFEAQYNFRFEAAEAAGGKSGAEFSNIGYARGQTMDTMRRKDDSRRQKRLARKERKEAERRAKEEHLKRLKNAKRQEMQRNLNEIKKVLGEVDGVDSAVDEAAIMKMMEGDYDPEKLEKIMQETFGDDFYEKEDSQWKSDKDVRDELAKDEDGDVLIGDGTEYDDGNEEEEDYNQHPESQTDTDGQDEWVSDEEFNEAHEDPDERDHPESELEKKLKSKMEDELYKLDYEDIVDGMPTRFKYRQVEANNYGLSTEEILFARDANLRQYVSLKKMAPYREDGEHAVAKSKRRAFRDVVKRDLEEMEAETTEGKQDEELDQANIAEEPKKKKRRKKKNKDTKVANETDDLQIDEGKSSGESDPKAGESHNTVGDRDNGEDAEKTKKRRRRRKKSNQSDMTRTTSDEKEAVPEDSTSKETTSSSGKDEKALSDTKSDITKEGARPKKQKKVKKKSKKAKKQKVEGISAARLGSYGL